MRVFRDGCFRAVFGGFAGEKEKNNEGKRCCILKNIRLLFGMEHRLHRPSPQNFYGGSIPEQTFARSWREYALSRSRRRGILTVLMALAAWREFCTECRGPSTS